MTEPRRTESNAVDYERRPPAVRRTTALAISAIVLALLTSPFVVFRLVDLLQSHFSAFAGLDDLHFAEACNIAPLMVAVAAIVRVLSSQRTRKGIPWAVLAMFLCVLWLFYFDAAAHFMDGLHVD
jgi:di/tricarboxylate transporter